ncbi:MAG: TraR/DksA C4-type zinc finger protein [Actinobacteria bacterium]|nr:TraR/DksA C4-type zinc finger protein [Actinomycetota bacterium]MDQ3533486.1 TraR/DksA C4-type zinc finger protein [Actinomycetota bacterium]
MDTKNARELLEADRVRLERIRDGVSEDQGLGVESQQASLSELSSYDQHSADIATETFEREKDESILEQVQGELNDIDHALARIENGTYGTCEACGKPIGDARLEAVPTARFCVEDQARAERDLRPPN